MKVGVTSPSFSKSTALRSRLESSFGDVIYNTDGVKLEGNALIDFAKDCEALIVGLDIINDDILKNLPKLKFISKYGVGLDGIDIGACEKYNISIGWTGGVNKRSASEMTLGFMLTLIRNMYPTSLRLRDGEWDKSGGRLLSAKTIGIIGFGNIGIDLAMLLRPFDCRILANDIIDISQIAVDMNVEVCDKGTLYSNSDIITIHTPLTHSTRNMISKAHINQMKDGVIIINAARGGIVNESDLYDALISGKVSSAAIDAFEFEPPFSSPLLNLKNVFSTPHIGGNAYEAVLAMGNSAIDHLFERFNLE